MSQSLQKGEFLPAIVHYLKSVGVQVQHWKANPSQEKAVPALSKGVFGVPLHFLPLSERAEGVPQFLVDACDLLRLHLHVEGLFRKCGSVTRIRALKSRLEAGENCLEMALPCDVATLVKQFLRELPQPLIPAELQGPLCAVQQREAGDLRDLLTVLLTCLFPQASAHTLRYLFSFLQEVAARSAQNKMDLANLAVVFAPNLFFLPGELCGKLDSQAEEQLHRQAAAIQALIGRATEIGTVPHPLLEEVQAASSDLESGRLLPSGAEDVEDGEAKARRRRQRRVGDIVTEALNKRKAGRALCNTPCQESKEGARGEDSPTNSSLKTSFNSKRKASDDVPELSAKKRRSILDSANSAPFADAGDAFDPPMAAGPRSPAPVVSSNSPSKPVSDAGSWAAGLRVQRQCSSCRKQPQRKRSFRATPACSPAPLLRRDPGRKSLRTFFRSSKYAVSPPEQPHPDSDKAGPRGWLLMKALGSPAWPQSWAQRPSYKLKERATGSPNPSTREDSAAPAGRDRKVPETLGDAPQGAGLSLCLDSITALHREPDPDVLLGSRGLRDKTEGLVLEGRPPASPLRRSLSWPEELSGRGAAEQEGTAFSPGEALSGPGGRGSQVFRLAEPDVEAIVAGVRQLRIPAVHGTPADDFRAGGPVSKPSPPAPKPEPLEAGLTLAHCLRQLNEVPKTGLKRLPLPCQRASPQANAGPRRSPPKHKGGRRFGRSVSHESRLPLQAQEGAPTESAAKRAAPGLPRKLHAFKACGQRIFLRSFAGLRRKKEGLPANPQNPERPAAVCQEAQDPCSARFPRMEMPC